MKIRKFDIGKGKEGRSISFFPVEGCRGKAGVLIVLQCPKCWRLTTISLNQVKGDALFVCGAKKEREKDLKILKEMHPKKVVPDFPAPCDFSEKKDYLKIVTDNILQLRGYK